MLSGPDFLPAWEPDQAAESQALGTPEGELHLRFYAGSSLEFALPAVGIREVIAQPPERISVIPNTSPLLLGAINLRGRIIWVADLGMFLGDSLPLNTDRPEIPVIVIEDEDQETVLGLAVDQVASMEWHDVETLELASQVPDSMVPFLKGEWVLDRKSQRFIRLLDQLSILRSPRWSM